MELVQTYFQDVAVLRRFLFAATHLPSEYPAYVQTVCNFAVNKSTHPPLEIGTAKILIENLKVLDDGAFVRDLDLMKQLSTFPNMDGSPTGIVLIPEQTNCGTCRGNLVLRSAISRSTQILWGQFQHFITISIVKNGGVGVNMCSIMGISQMEKKTTYTIPTIGTHYLI